MPRRPEAAPGQGGRGAEFRPHFMLVVLYLAAFYVLFALAFALPDLLQAARELPPGPASLSPEELERAKSIARQALAGGRVVLAFLAAAAAVGVLAWTRSLPGLR